MTPTELSKAYATANAAWTSRSVGNSIEGRDLAESTAAKNRLFKDPEALQVLNAGTNTIDATLQRDAVLNVIVSDFSRRLLPLQAFTTVFQRVPLLGTNKVQVPFYALDAGGSTSFKSTDGYLAGDTATDNREIQVGKRADADVLDDTKQYDRKYQGLSLSSEELARQPFLNTVALARFKAEKLANDILQHVLGIITAANYGAAAITKVTALFGSDDLAALKLACKLWPEGTRSLVLDSAYDAALLKDPAFKAAYAAASDRAIREGKILPVVFGFNYLENPTIPGNGENLVGFAAQQSAILFAQAPVPPAPAVLNAGTTYSVATDDTTGVSLEYRAYGNSQRDRAENYIEANYGFAKGLAEALKRIVSA